MNVQAGISAPGGEVKIDDASFRCLTDIVHRESGIVLAEGKRNFIVSRLSRRLRELGMAGFSDYCECLKRRDSQEERITLVSLLTTNVTRFFRENHHFEALKQDILPDLIKRARGGGRVRFWSAGCSSGEEPYSIAMCLREAMPDAASHDIRILATDIDPKVVETGRQGIYAGIDESHLPAARRDRHFDPVDGRPGAFRAGSDLRGLITFAQLNLLQDWPMKGQFDVIFCRNVVIYFNAETQDGLWPKFAAALTPGGHLFLGHSERVSRMADHRLKSNGITQYTRI